MRPTLAATMGGRPTRLDDDAGAGVPSEEEACGSARILSAGGATRRGGREGPAATTSRAAAVRAITIGRFLPAPIVPPHRELAHLGCGRGDARHEPLRPPPRHVARDDARLLLPRARGTETSNVPSSAIRTGTPSTVTSEPASTFRAPRCRSQTRRGRSGDAQEHVDGDGVGAAGRTPRNATDLRPAGTSTRAAGLEPDDAGLRLDRERRPVRGR
jgi:hypothetical protein